MLSTAEDDGQQPEQTEASSQPVAGFSMHDDAAQADGATEPRSKTNDAAAAEASEGVNLLQRSRSHGLSFAHDAMTPVQGLDIALVQATDWFRTYTGVNAKALWLSPVTCHPMVGTP